MLATRLDWLVNDQLALIRTEFGRFTRQVSGYSLEHLLPENGANLARFLVGTEGTLAITTQGHRAAGERTAGGRAGRARLPGHAGGGRRGAGAAAAPAGRDRGHGRAAGRGRARPRRAPRPCPTCPAATAGCSSRRPARRSTRRAPTRPKVVADAGCARFRRSSPARPPGRCGAFARTAPGSAAARRRMSRPGPAGRTPPCRPTQLGAYLREFGELMRALRPRRAGVRPLRRRLRAFAHRLPVPHRAAGLSAVRHRRRDAGRASSAARCRASTAMDGPAASCCRSCTRPRRSPRSARQGDLRPGQPAQPGRDRRARCRSTTTLRVPAARPMTTRLGFAYAHDGGDFTTAVHRCVGVGKCRADTTAVGGVMCPSYLATRDEKDSTRARARVLQELANGSLVHGFGSREVAESLDLCLSCKGCSSDCPAGVDMATYKAEALYQRYRRRLRPLAHYSLGRLPRWAALAARAAAAGQRAAAAAARSARVAKRLGGIDRRRPLPRFAPRTFRQWFADRARGHRQRRRARRAAVGRHVHQPLQPRGRTGRGRRCSRTPATRCGSSMGRPAAG